MTNLVRTCVTIRTLLSIRIIVILNFLCFGKNAEAPDWVLSSKRCREIEIENVGRHGPDREHFRHFRFVLRNPLGFQTLVFITSYFSTFVKSSGVQYFHEGIEYS